MDDGLRMHRKCTVLTSHFLASCPRAWASSRWQLQLEDTNMRKPARKPEETLLICHKLHTRTNTDLQLIGSH
jgi:hypothetical protein